MSAPVLIGCGLLVGFYVLLALLVALKFALDLFDESRARRVLGEADRPVGGPVCPGRGSETVSLAECTPRSVILADRRRSCA